MTQEEMHRKDIENLLRQSDEAYDRGDDVANGLLLAEAKRLIEEHILRKPARDVQLTKVKTYDDTAYGITAPDRAQSFSLRI